MSSIIVAFPEDLKALALKICETLKKSGFNDVRYFSYASEALREIYLRDGGILISSVHLPDMYYLDLQNCLPNNFKLLLLDSKENINTLRTSETVALSFPINAYDLINTLKMMLAAASSSIKRKHRSSEEQYVIDTAKALLMNNRQMSEEEAYRYIQKASMNSGRTILEVAKIIIHS